eukprot:m.335287 g.335287  ORF g.335287 m.335287 type:complete len:434 (-) comp17562_c0_seq1:58-1359(-)
MSSSEPPPVYQRVMFELLTKSSEDEMKFLTEALGAKEECMYRDKKEKVIHAAAVLNGTQMMLADRDAEIMGGSQFPEACVRLWLQYEDDSACLAMEKKMLENGCTSMVKVEDQYWGSKFGCVKDSMGVFWCLGTVSKGRKLQPYPKALERNHMPEVAVNDAESYLAWLEKVLDAKKAGEVHKMNGKVMHAEIKINDGLLAIHDHQEGDPRDAEICVALQMCNAIETSKQFVKAGGTVVMEVKKQFWDQVYGRVKDKHGIQFALCEAFLIPEANIAEESMPSMKVMGVTIEESSFPEIPKKMKGGLDLVDAYLKDKNEKDFGKKATVWHSNGKPMKFTVGVILKEGQQPTKPDNFAIVEAGGCNSLTVVHTGPPDSVPSSWKAIFGHAKNNNLKTSMPSMEIYESSAPVEESQTRLYVPLENGEPSPKKQKTSA